jgi:hypothetical protein
VETPNIPARIVAPVRRALAGEAVAWPDLTPEEVGALTLHGVGPLVYSVARAPRLREQAMHAAVLETMRLEDLHAVLAALASRGVVPLLMKGTPLAYDVYPAPELRPRGDTDLLIARDAIDTTRDVLLELGFAERITSGDEHGVRQALFTRLDGYGFEHAYDVHWDITNTALFAETLRFDELRARAVNVPKLGVHALALSHVDALLLACIHRVAHHHDSDRLIWLYDIALLRDRMSRDEHERFWRLAAERRVVGVCIRSIELADEWCGRVPHHRAEEFLSREEIEREEPSRVYLDREITYGGVMLADLRALPWSARVERLRQLAFPPRDFMQQQFRSRSRFALPWLYVYRGARGLVRLFRRARA